MSFISPEKELPFTRKQLLIVVYVCWILSCTVFFILGLRLGRVSLPTMGSSNQHHPSPSGMLVNGSGQGERLAATAAANATYTVQVTVVSTAGEANQVVAELRRRGFTSAYVTLPAPDSPTQLYTVKVGFYNLPTANQVVEELQRELGFRNARVTGN